MSDKNARQCSFCKAYIKTWLAWYGIIEAEKYTLI